MANHIVLNPSSINISQPKKKSTVLARYFAFCDSQASADTFWYLLALLFLGTALMPVAIYYTQPYAWYLPFVGVSVLFLFTNILLAISEQSIRLIITFFLFSVFFVSIVPILSYFFG